MTPGANAKASRFAVVGALLSFLAACRTILSVLAVAACDGGRGVTAGGCSIDAATYACSPVAPDEGGCEGNAEDGAFVVYPLGCQATFPGCGGPSSSSQSCTCVANVDYGFGDAQAVFVCGN